ncbi:hypothetical protein Tco_0812915 [Tanacetum coccineum]
MQSSIFINSINPLSSVNTIPTTIPDTIPTVTPPTTHVDTTLTPTEIPTISPIVSPSPNYTPASPDYSPASDTKPDPSEDPSSNHIPLPATSPFLSSTNDSSDSDTPDTPPSPTHEIPPIEVAPPTGQILPAPFGVRRRRVTIVSPGKPIPYGRLYCYHPNGLVHMMTGRKRVGPLPTHRLVVRHSVDYSSSDHFTSDDSSRDSPSDSSSEMSSDSSSDALSDSSSADLLPSPKRIRSFNSVTDLEVSSDESSKSSVPRENSLRDDVDVKGNDEPHSEHDIDPEVQVEIDECATYADTLRARGIDARVVVEVIDREEVETGVRGMVVVRDDRVTHHVVSDDIPKPAQEEGAIEFTKHRIVATGQQSAILSERISELERDNTRLRGTLDVASLRVTRIQRRELRVQREMRQIRHLRFYDRVRIGRLEACARKHLGYHP